MVAAPEAIPVTIPEDPTVATDAVLLLHVPPVALSDNAVVAASHTEVAPVMLPAFGEGFTVIVFEA